MDDSVPGRLLRIDLDDGSVASEPVPEGWIRRYLGGKGLGARYLYRELDPGTDPLAADNVVLFLAGPLSGVLPGDPRYAAVTKSPLTGTFLDSYSGGSFAARLVGSLGDHVGVLVEGAAENPVAVHLEGGSATLEPAGDLWGLDVVETCDVHPDAAVACVGPAGENRVAYATVGSDRGEHQAGRGGVGAVLGAKRLKAVVAHDASPPLEALSGLREEYERRYEETDAGRWIAAGGTLESVDFANEVGVLSTRGWQEGTFEGTDDVGIQAAKAAADGRERDEDAVPGGFRVNGGDRESVPRGATSMTLGAGLGIDDFDAVATLGETCDRLGLDVISAGNVVAWAIRASQEGVLDRDLSFGDGDAAREMLEAIATRETDLADALAGGVTEAATRYGGEDLVPTVKAMETPSYDPRGSLAMALAYATSDRGACHRRALPVEREAFRREAWDDARRVRVVCREQTVRSLLWSLVADDFAGEVLREDLGREWLAAVGLEYGVEELARVGERVWTLTRLFNVREGFDRSDDGLPAAFTRPLADGPAAGRSIDPARFDRLLDRYYAIRGWSEDGVPSAPLLDRLGLAEIVDDATPVAPEPASLPSEREDAHDPRPDERRTD